MVDERAFEAFALSGAVLAVLTGEASRPSTWSGGDLHRNDEVDRNNNLVVDARPAEPGLPDPWFVSEYEAGGGHRGTERGPVGQAAGIGDDVGVGRERLIGGKPPGGAKVHRLGTDEHHSIELLAKR